MQRKITVLIVETGNHGGGSFESVYQNIRNLDRDRFKPILFYLNATPYVQKMRNLGAEVHVVGDILYNNRIPDILKRIIVGSNWGLGRIFPKLTPIYEWVIHLRPILALRRIVRSKNVNIIHLNNNMVRNFFCLVGLKGLGVPILSYFRSFIISGANPFMAEYSNRHVTQYVAYSGGVRDYWGHVGVDTTRFEIVHNGIEIEDIPALDVWHWIGIDRRRPIVGCIGTVKVNRTYDFMIKSFARILREEPEAFLIIVGKWLDRGLGEKLEQLVRDLGIESSVKFHGGDPRGKEIIAGLDILTIPYRVEPYGRILLEAWLAKTPVIATRVGHIDKIISHNKDGVLVEHGDEEDMAQAVLKVWRDKAFAENLVTEGRRTVENRFSIYRCTKDLEAVYEKIKETYWNRIHSNP